MQCAQESIKTLLRGNRHTREYQTLLVREGFLAYVLDKGKSQQDNEKTILVPLLQISICWSSCHIGEL